MPKILYITFLLIIIFVSTKLSAQELAIDTVNNEKESNFHLSSLIIPSILMGYGVIAIESDDLKLLNSGIREEVTENIDDKISIDDFSQYMPALSVYGLDLLGVKGKNNFRNKSIILATSFLIMSSTVTGMKYLTKIERPDGSANNSFPSGHTATAFMEAEYLWQEYSDVSVWYGIAGYAVATGTGIFRMLNNRHWLSDVTMGAGIGMLSTKIAYWLSPFLTTKLFEDNRDNHSSAMLYPTLNSEQIGFGLLVNF